MTTFNLPDLGEGLAEAEVVAWHVKVGDRVKVDQPMLSVETAKAVVEVPSPYSGVIRALYAAAGDMVATGKPLVDFDIEGAVSMVKTAEPAKARPRVADDSGTVVGSMPTSDEELVEHAVAGGQRAVARDRVRAAPAVRALARRLGVELASVPGSGRGGLITVDDVMTASQLQPARPQVGGTAARPAAAAPLPSGESERLRGPRRAMAHSMALARDQIAGCTLFDDADLDGWIRKTDFTVRLLRALAAGCRAEPGLNAWYDGESQSRKLIARVDVAIAVDTAEGLIVPVVRDIANRSAAELRTEVERLKTAAQARAVAPEELKDFTLMLSNFGMIAGRYATPIVVPPAVAILGAGGLRHDVVAVMGGIEAHLRLPLSLTFDHRCVTGGEAARFLAAVIKDLEQPD